MHRLFDEGETHDKLALRRHHPLVRRAFGASGLDIVAVAGWFLSRVGEISILMKVIEKRYIASIRLLERT